MHCFLSSPPIQTALIHTLSPLQTLKYHAHVVHWQVFYANGLFNAEVTTLIGLGTSPLQASMNAAAIAMIALPGYYLSFAFINLLGRRAIQVGGFLMLGLLYSVIGVFFHQLRRLPVFFLLIYASTFLFSNFGPNATTYVVPGEIFPPEIKATAHGVSSASGKIGAALGSFMFPPLADQAGIRGVMCVCGVLSLIGAILSVMLTPSMPTTDGSPPLLLARHCMRNGLIMQSDADRGDPRSEVGSVTTNRDDEGVQLTLLAAAVSPSAVEDMSISIGGVDELHADEMMS